MTSLHLRAWIVLLSWIPWVLVVTGPQISRADGPKIPCDVSRLENGLTVILHRDPTAPGVSVNLVYRVGSAVERPGESGVAHLVEHLMFDGSAHVPTGAFDQWLEEAGGRANAATGEDFTVFWQDVPPGALELALFLESDRMAYLGESLDAQRVESEKQIVAREREYLYDRQPYARAEWAMRSALFPEGHPYAIPVIGDAEDVEGLSLETVVEFYRAYYRPANASLVVAGNIDIGPSGELVRKWFSSIPGGPTFASRVVEPVTLAEDRVLVTSDNTVGSAKLVLAWPSAAAMSADEPSLVVLADLIAGSSGSRLEEVLVRERDLATSVSARQESLRHGGLFTIEVVARREQALDPVLRSVDDAIQHIATHGVSKKELRQSIAGITTDLLTQIERIGGYAGLARRLNTYWVYAGAPDSFARDLGRYDAVKPRSIRNAARRWLGRHRVVLSVVPEGHRELAARSGAAK